MKSRKHFTTILLSFFILIFTSSSHSQTKIGINTTSPMAALHVKDSSVLFSGQIVLPVLPKSPPIQGSGHRHMWYVDKSSLAIGKTINNNWDKDSIGIYSFIFGKNSIAQGMNSMALGENARVNGNNGMALGKNSFVSINGGFAFGNNVDSKGTSSIAIGIGNVAIGHESIAMGRSTLSVGMNATSMGFFTDANGNTSFATGEFNNANGDLSMVFGKNNNSKPFHALAFGRNNSDCLICNATVWFSSHPILFIGNGSTATDLRNALVINKKGETGINISSNFPQSLFHIKSILNNNDHHILLENRMNSKSSTIHFDGNLNFQKTEQSSEFIWKDSIGNALLKLNSNGNSTIDSLVEFISMAVSDHNDVIIIQDNQLITVGNRTYLRILSDSPVEVNRTINLSSGVTIGQILLLECAEPSTSSNGFEIIDDGVNRNTNTNGGFFMNRGDTAQFIWNGIDWLLMRRSDN